MGRVYLARDERSGGKVALKLLTAAFTKEGKERHRLRREARALASVSHPAIVRILDVLENEQDGWLVMEYLEGEQLTVALRRGPLASRQAVAMFGELARALAVVHSQEILHRDLKTDNVMLTPDGVKLLDFGLARWLSSDGSQDSSMSNLTATGRVLGTAHAMSPEQATGESLSPQSDLFSLGMMLYETVTGEHPFRAASRLATLHRLCYSRQVAAHRLEPTVPEVLSELIDRLLEKDPKQRPRDAETVAEALDRLLESRLAAADPEGATRRPIARHDPASLLDKTRLERLQRPSSGDRERRP